MDNVHRTMTAHSATRDFLRRNNATYEAIVNVIRKLNLRTNAEVALRYVERAAKFAIDHHTGRFSDERLERVALAIGCNLERRCRKQSIPLPVLMRRACLGMSERRILHVADGVGRVGGHTRLIRNWASQDTKNRHSLVVVRQRRHSIPTWLFETFSETAGDMFVMPFGASMLAKSKCLREISVNYDLVVVHHFWDDVVPVVAFATPQCPPVVVLNHADHLFGLGSSIADAVINFRTLGSRLSAERRGTRCNVVLPLPLIEGSSTVTRADARRRLGISDGCAMLLSVGRYVKYQPNEEHSFFLMARRLLERNPNARVFVVGLDETTARAFSPDVLHERLHFAGEIEDPSLYRLAADVYLESFPFGSQTALLEAALAGVAPVLAYGPRRTLLTTDDDALAGLLRKPRNVEEYIDQATSLVQDAEKRTILGDSVRTQLRSSHAGSGWLRALSAVYDVTDALKHRVVAITTRHSMESDEDIAVGAWHRGQIEPTPSSGSGSHDLFALAYRAREEGAYNLALRFLCEANNISCDRLMFASKVGKLVVHRILNNFAA